MKNQLAQEKQKLYIKIENICLAKIQRIGWIEEFTKAVKQ